MASICGRLTPENPSHMTTKCNHNHKTATSSKAETTPNGDFQNYETYERCPKSPRDENRPEKQATSKRSSREEKLNKVLRSSGRVCPVYDSIVENIRQALLSVDPAVNASLPLDLEDKKRRVSDGDTKPRCQCKCKRQGKKDSCSDSDESLLSTYILLYNGKEMEVAKLTEELAQKDAVLVTYLNDLELKSKQVKQLERELKANKQEFCRCQKELEKHVLAFRDRDKELDELKSMVCVYQSQANAFKEDFEQEREDREKAQMKIQDLMTQLKIKNEVLSWSSPNSTNPGSPQACPFASESPAQIEYVADCPYKKTATRKAVVQCDGGAPLNNLNSPYKSPRASVALFENSTDAKFIRTPEINNQERQVRDLSRDPDLTNYIVVETDRRQHALSRHILSPTRSVPILPGSEPRRRPISSFRKTPSLDSSLASSHHGRIFDCSSSSGQTTPSRGSCSPSVSSRASSSCSTIKATHSPCCRKRYDESDGLAEYSSASGSSVASNLQCPKCALSFPTEKHMDFVDHLDECCK